MIPGGILSKKYHPKLMLLGIAAFAPFAFFFSAYMPTFSLWVLMITLCFSVFMQLCYLVPVHHIWLWFPDKPGTSTGVMFASLGFAGFGFNNLALYLVNPNGTKAIDGQYPPEVNANVPFMLRSLSYIFLFLISLAILMIFPGPNPQETP